MIKEREDALRSAFETAYIDREVVSNLAYMPQFISNNHTEGKKVLASIEDELLSCDSFQISVAFITMGGITPLLQTLKELEQKNIPGKILTTNYLSFSDPEALKRLHDLRNIELRMFNVDEADEGFHTKGYIFKKDEIYRIIIGSSNITSAALTTNREWNTRVVSTENGEITGQVLEEFEELWNSDYSLPYESFIDDYREKFNIVKHQRQVAKEQEIIEIDDYKLKPNSMQTGFISNLRSILEKGEGRALLISATGTGKTFASAFAMREIGFKKILFLVHREQLAVQTLKSYRRVFGRNTSMGLVGGGKHETNADYIFATVQTLCKEEHLKQFSKDRFDCIVLDEAHHSPANSYKKIMDYFEPKLWLGMTATPDKMDDNQEGRNVYELFNYQIAYEIRLQQAMELNLLCPFNYFGISDLKMIDDDRKNSDIVFNRLVADERVRHIVDQANYYGYSGDRVKGLIFCSSIKESQELSRKLNEAPYNLRTIALNGDASEAEREEAFERLAMDIKTEADEKKALDYILSVEILNEGVDIVEVNQVIMLRPTQSPIVFIQQLGRGLRKATGKEYVNVLDFIGNYEKNFLIPVALSGDRTYNPEVIRHYLTSGNNTIPGASTIHFDAISRERIFRSIDHIKGKKAIIRESYTNLKNRLGRVPYLADFYEYSEVDPQIIIEEYGYYAKLLASMEPELFAEAYTEEENTCFEYLSKTILSGMRPYELEMLRAIMAGAVEQETLKETIKRKYSNISYSSKSLERAIGTLKGNFVSKEDERARYANMEIIETDGTQMRCGKLFSEQLKKLKFRKQIEDIVSVGLGKYHNKYEGHLEPGNPFVLYERYSRRDVCMLIDNETDMASTMYGMKRFGDDVFIFITYHKEDAKDSEKRYVEGKPDYADAFADTMTFLWDSQIGKGPDSPYMHDVCDAPRKHLFVKKSDAEKSFYYLGMFDVMDVKAATKLDNNHVEKTISKVTMKMKHAVREDLLRYLESASLKENMK